MNPTIPNDWLPHGYCPRDLYPSVRLEQQNGHTSLQLTKGHWFLAFISLLLTMACFAFLWLFPWGAETNDHQMKWVLFGGGCVFTWIAIVSMLTGYRFSKRGQSLTIPVGRQVVVLKSGEAEEQIPVASLKSLQILSKGGTAQLILVHASDKGVERRWIHTDSEWHIESLAESLCRVCGIEILSRSKVQPRKPEDKQ